MISCKKISLIGGNAKLFLIALYLCKDTNHFTHNPIKPTPKQAITTDNTTIKLSRDS